ncbi:MAG TPA: LysR family transcriptional regulator, partial [Acinetobacter sp.]|nr:LysR family transcriptional regulator [Acinetobacter sp.]
SSLIVRDVIKTDHCLVAAPELLQGHTILDASELQNYPSISLGNQKQNYLWHLCNIRTGATMEIPYQPRVKSNDLAGVYYAVADGLGIADLPFLTVEADIRKGRLIHILPEWKSNIGTLQLVYGSRKGQRLVVEKLIETLVETLRRLPESHKGYLAT